MFYSYTESKYQKYVHRIFHQINAPILVAIFQKFCCRKEALGYAKVIHEKEKKKRKKKLKKWTSVRDI